MNPAGLFLQLAKAIFTYVRLREGHTERIENLYPGIDHDRAAKAGARAALHEIVPTLDATKESALDFFRFLFWVVIVLFGMCVGCGLLFTALSEPS